MAEFDALSNRTIALKGDATSAPNLVLHLDTTGATNIQVSYTLRDLDASANNAAQAVAVQYRVGSTGSFINLPSGFVADATDPNAASRTTRVTVTLPGETYDRGLVQVRIITADAVGPDEWVGVDDIVVDADPLPSATLNLDVDPSQSSLTLSGNIKTDLGFGPLTFTIVEQAAGSLTTSYDGSQRAVFDPAAGTIRFVETGTVLDANVSGNWSPAEFGDAGFDPADYGGRSNLGFFGTADVAARDLFAALSTVAGVQLTGSGNSLSFASTQNLAILNGFVDYRAEDLGAAGFESLADQSATNSAAAGTFAVSGTGGYTITSPISVTIQQVITTDDGLEFLVTLNLNGSLQSASVIPVVDLNGPAAGSHVLISYPGGRLALAPTATVSKNVTSPLLTSVRAVLVDRPDGANEFLSVDLGASGLSVTSYNPATGELVIQGTASPDTYQQVLRTLGYTNTAAVGTPGNRVVQVFANDGTNLSLARTIVIDVDVNDLPVLTVPAGLTALAGQTLAVPGGSFAVADPDAGVAAVTVTLSVPSGQGMLSVATNITGGVTAGQTSGNGTGSVTVTAPLAAINATLAATGGVLFAAPAGGPVTLTVSANDGGASGTGGVKTASAVVPITVLTPPTLAGAGGPVGYTEGAPATAVAPALTVASGPNVTTATASITSGFQPGDALTFAPSGGLVGSFNPTTMVLTISGSGSAAAYQQVLRSVRFAAPGDTPVAGDRVIEFAAANVAGGSSRVSVTVQVTSVNDPPVIASPAGPIVVVTSGSIVFAGTTAITVSDPDVAAGTVTLSVTTTGGTVSLSGTSGLTGDGNGTTALAYKGTLAAVSAALTGLTYSAPSGTGGQTITITVDDQGNTGGPAASTSVNILIDVRLANRPPVNTVPGPQNGTEDTPLIFSSANANAIVAADPDAGSAPVRVRLAATNGVVTLASTSGLTIIAGNSVAARAVTITGSLTAVNAALEGLVFTPDAEFSGAAALEVSTNDLGNIGVGGALDDTDTIPITFAAVNDPPVSAGESFSVLAGSTLTIAASGVLANDRDVDSTNLQAVEGTLADPTLGSLVLNPDGSFSFTPAAGFVGVTSFTYRLTDGALTIGPVTVGLTVIAVPVDPVPPPPPIVVPPDEEPPNPPPVVRLLAAGTDLGGAAARLVDASGGIRLAVDPFPGFTGGARVASGDFNGDGIPDLAVGTGPGRATRVIVYNGASGAQLFAVDPFEGTFTGGVYVAAGDLTGDGRAELVISPDLGGGPRVRIFDGAGFGQLADFFGIDDPNFRGGVRATVADFDGDGVGDLVVAAGFGGGPRVAIFGGPSVVGGTPARLTADFFAFEETLRNGAFVAAGDVTGDGRAELVAGGGPSGGPRVLVFDGLNLLAGRQGTVADFFAGDPANRGGVRVAAADLDGDGFADVAAGDGEGTGGRVAVYLGQSLRVGAVSPAAVFEPFDGLSGGVFVG